MSLGSNGEDSVRSLQKVRTWLRATNFCINCTSSHCFVPSFMQLRNDPKCTQTLCNSPKTWVLGPTGRIGCTRCENFWRDFVAGTFALITPVHPVLHRVSCSYEMIPNAAKHYATHQNMTLGSNGADWVRSLQKIPMWLRVTNFCINCTNSPRFAPSFRQLRNDTKCSQTLCNTTKHEFRVQWSGFGAIVAKNSDVTSCHGLLH